MTAALSWELSRAVSYFTLRNREGERWHSVCVEPTGRSVCAKTRSMAPNCCAGRCVARVICSFDVISMSLQIRPVV